MTADILEQVFPVCVCVRTHSCNESYCHIVWLIVVRGANTTSHVCVHIHLDGSVIAFLWFYFLSIRTLTLYNSDATQSLWWTSMEINVKNKLIIKYVCLMLSFLYLFKAEHQKKILKSFFLLKQRFSKVCFCSGSSCVWIREPSSPLTSCGRCPELARSVRSFTRVSLNLDTGTLMFQMLFDWSDQKDQAHPRRLPRVLHRPGQSSANHAISS